MSKLHFIKPEENLTQYSSKMGDSVSLQPASSKPDFSAYADSELSRDLVQIGPLVRPHRGGAQYWDEGEERWKMLWDKRDAEKKKQQRKDREARALRNLPAGTPDGSRINTRPVMTVKPTRREPEQRQVPVQRQRPARRRESAGGIETVTLE